MGGTMPWPENLTDIFPCKPDAESFAEVKCKSPPCSCTDPTKNALWTNFYGNALRNYLNKDEYVSGAFGIEGRYPFLDKEVVQEYLWLSASVKNSRYKRPIADYLEKYGYPFAEGGPKVGFNADPVAKATMVSPGKGTIVKG